MPTPTQNEDGTYSSNYGDTGFKGSERQAVQIEKDYFNNLGSGNDNAATDAMLGMMDAAFKAGLKVTEKAIVNGVDKKLNKQLEVLKEHKEKAYSLFKNKEYDGAIEEFTKARNAGAVVTMQIGWQLTWMRGRCYKEKGDYDNAIADYTTAISETVQGNHVECYFSRALAYTLKKDYDNAISDYSIILFYFEDYKFRHNAYYNRGNCYRLKGDWKNAAFDYRKAAEMGQESAKKALQDYASEIAAQDASDKKQFEADLKSANNGDIEACYRLGDCYYRGIATTQNDNEAFKWFFKAAEKGHIISCRQIGNAYFKGKGISKDDKQAIKWYKKIEKEDAIAKLWFKYDGYGKGFWFVIEKISSLVIPIIGAIIGGGFYLIASYSNPDPSIIITVLMTVIFAVIGIFAAKLISKFESKFFTVFAICVVIALVVLSKAFVTNRMADKLPVLKTEQTESNPKNIKIVGTATVTSDGQKLGSDNAEVLKTLNAGDRVNIIGRRKKMSGYYFYPVEHEGTIGWIHEGGLRRDR